MVSATSFPVYDATTATSIAATAAHLAPAVKRAARLSSFQLKLSGIDLNGVAPASLADLIDLGHARRDPTAATAPAAAAKAFSPTASEKENDVLYFKGLLEARSQLQLQLENKLKTLQHLRRRNNRIAKRKFRKSAKDRAAAAAPPGNEAGAVATERPKTPDSEPSIATTGALSTVTGATGSTATCVDRESVSEQWRVHPHGDIPICSSPISTESGDMCCEMGSGCGGKQGGQRITDIIPVKQSIYHRA